MSMQIKGTIQQILKVESGTSKAGKEWKKQDFVVVTDEKFPKTVCITLFGDKMSLLDPFSEGMEVEVSINIESREFNGKWFHNVTAWKIDSVGSTQNSNDSENEPIYQSGLSIKEQIMEQKAQEPEPEGDDLPF